MDRLSRLIMEYGYGKEKGFWIRILEMGEEYKGNFANSTLLSLAFIVYLDESVFRR